MIKFIFFVLTEKLTGMTVAKFIFIIGISILFGCNNQETRYSPTYSNEPTLLYNEYIFGIHPLYNPKALQEIYGPLVDTLSQLIPNAVFRLEASKDYAAFDQKLYAGKFHFALPNPYQTVNAIKKGYRVFGKQGDDYKFTGIIIVRKDSDINLIQDLKGKSVSFPAPTALAATMMPQYYIYEHGLNVMEDIEIKYVGSQESSIMSVLTGNTAAGATWPVPWLALIKKRPEIAEQLEVKWETEPLVNNSLVVRNDIPDSLVTQVSEIIFALHTHKDGQKILKRMEVSKYEKANNSTYSIVEIFLKKFNTEVRPIKIAKSNKQ